MNIMQRLKIITYSKRKKKYPRSKGGMIVVKKKEIQEY